MNIHRKSKAIKLEKMFTGGALSELAYRVFAGEKVSDELIELLEEDYEIIQDVKQVLDVAQYTLDIQELDRVLEDFNEKYEREYVA